MRAVPAALLAACAAVAALLAPTAAPAKGKELHLYTWSDYVKPELIERFEKEQKCRVVIDTFDANESMYAKLNHVDMPCEALLNVVMPAQKSTDMLRVSKWTAAAQSATVATVPGCTFEETATAPGVSPVRVRRPNPATIAMS